MLSTIWYFEYAAQTPDLPSKLLPGFSEREEKTGFPNSVSSLPVTDVITYNSSLPLSPCVHFCCVYDSAKGSPTTPALLPKPVALLQSLESITWHCEEGGAGA